MQSQGAARQLQDEGWLEFGSFRLEANKKVLWRNGHVFPLAPRAVDTLSILVARRGQIVPKEELIGQIWGETVVEDCNLTHNISVLRKILKEDPSSNCRIETVPKRGYRFCDASPLNRGGVRSAASHRPQLSVTIGTPSTPRKSVNRWLGVGVILATLAFLGVAGLHLSKSRPLEKFHARRSVAVVGFANLSQKPDSAWLSLALAQMMTTELGAGGELLTIPDESVARVRTELKLDNRDGFSAETLEQLRQSLNTDIVVSGAYTILLSKSTAQGNGRPAEDSRVRLDLRVQNAATGEALDTVSETGEQSSLFELVARAGARVRRDLGVEIIAPEDAEQARSSISSNPQAVRLYAQGIEKLRNFDTLGARDLLQQAAAADPNYALAYSALAEAWMTLGYDARAEQAGQTAYQLSSKLGLEQKLLIEGQYREAAHQWKEAVTAYATLFKAYPDNLEYGLRLAGAQRLAAEYRDVLATVQALRKLPPPAGSDPRIDLEEAMAGITSGDVASARRAASAAEQKGRQRASTLLVARAKMLQPVANSPAFVAEQEDARHICESLGDTDCTGQALLRIARSQIARPVAKASIEQALALFNQVGDQRRVGEAHTVMGLFFLYQGKLVEAGREYSQARATCEAIGDRSCVTLQILVEGNIASSMGDVPKAEKKYREALAMARQTGEDQLIWGSQNNIAGLLSDYEGKLSEAESIYRQLAENDRKNGKEARMNFALSNLGAVVAEEGRLTEARQILTEVEERSVKSGGRAEFGASAVTLAELDVVEGRPEVAEARLRPMAQLFEEQKDGIAVTYYDGIAEALLAQNKPAEAARVVAYAKDLLGSGEKGFPAYHLMITEAKVDAAAQPDNAVVRSRSLAALREVIAQCHKRGFVGLDLQARLAESEIEMRSGASSLGQAHLASLERDATNKGFGLIARQASAAR